MEKMTEQHERECPEYRQTHDPLKHAGWPLISYILDATTEGTIARKQAMDKLLQAVEEIRMILNRSHMH
jgi:hypothetical protein